MQAMQKGHLADTPMQLQAFLQPPIKSQEKEGGKGSDRKYTTVLCRGVQISNLDCESNTDSTNWLQTESNNFEYEYFWIRVVCLEFLKQKYKEKNLAHIATKSSTWCEYTEYVFELVPPVIIMRLGMLAAGRTLLQATTCTSLMPLCWQGTCFQLIHFFIQVTFHFAKLFFTALVLCQKANPKGYAMLWSFEVCMSCGRANLCSSVREFRTFENFDR